jgi:hypothetical protein
VNAAGSLRAGASCQRQFAQAMRLSEVMLWLQKVQCSAAAGLLHPTLCAMRISVRYDLQRPEIGSHDAGGPITETKHQYHDRRQERISTHSTSTLS